MKLKLSIFCYVISCTCHIFSLCIFAILYNWRIKAGVSQLLPSVTVLKLTSCFPSITSPSCVRLAAWSRHRQPQEGVKRTLRSDLSLPAQGTSVKTLDPKRRRQKTEEVAGGGIRKWCECHAEVRAGDRDSTTTAVDGGGSDLFRGPGWPPL